MQKTIQLGAIAYPYTLRRSLRSTRLSLRVSAGGRLSISAPIFVTERMIESFLLERAAWIEAAVRRLEGEPKLLIQRGGRREYLKHKEAARRMAFERLVYWNQFYGFKYGRVSIRNQKTRWGSCSKQRNLSFNYRIALLPLELADYIILHELCHIKAFDHSDRFWRLMEKTMPDYEKRRQQLKRAA